MRIRISYAVNLTDEVRRGMKHHYGLRNDIGDREMAKTVRSFCEGNGAGALEDATSDCLTESGPDCNCNLRHAAYSFDTLRRERCADRLGVRSRERICVRQLQACDEEPTVRSGRMTTPQHFYSDLNMNMRIADREGIEGVIVIAHFGGHYDWIAGYDYDTKPEVYASTEETR